MLDCGGIESARALHEARFSPSSSRTARVSARRGRPAAGRPAARDVKAFSIDDVTTTEIDDAFSVEHLADGRVRIGIHIAAPALGIARGDAADAIARTRLSTVYMPGDKITMLPDDVVDASRSGRRHAPGAVALLIVNRETQEIVANETRAERVFVKSNLRHNTLDEVVTKKRSRPAPAIIRTRTTSRCCGRSRRRCSRSARPRAPVTACAAKQRAIPTTTSTSKASTSTITPRRRGSPLDMIVAELAILANSTWARSARSRRAGHLPLAARFGAPGPKRTRMQTTPRRTKASASRSTRGARRRCAATSTS
jgi:exoribonuclease-2